MMASRPSSDKPKPKMEPAGNSTSDPINCLKFGKKIYFAEPSSSKSPPPPQPETPAPPSRRRGKGAVAQRPRCQVEGCDVDLTGSKAYYCRHKVCGMHSKAPRVVVSGISQRFCQQCSRFHQLAEFDQGKRSCRKRLAGHNERRRKPPQVPSSSCFGRLASSFHAEDPNRYRGYSDFTYLRAPPSTNRDLWPVIRPVNLLQAPFVRTGSNPYMLDPNPLCLPTGVGIGTTADSLCALSLLSNGSIIPSYNSNGPLGFRAEGPDMGQAELVEFSGNELELALQGNSPNLGDGSGRAYLDGTSGLGMN